MITNSGLPWMSASGMLEMALPTYRHGIVFDVGDSLLLVVSRTYCRTDGVCLCVCAGATKKKNGYNSLTISSCEDGESNECC